MSAPLSVGKTAPDFELKDGQGKSHALKDLLANGPAFLVFYPGDLTPGCTIQLCTIRDEWSDFQKQGVTVVGINPGGETGHKLFSKLYHLPFPLLMDSDKSVCRAYGALTSTLGFEHVKRTVVGIDKTGIVRYMKEGMPKPTELLKAAKSW